MNTVHWPARLLLSGVVLIVAVTVLALAAVPQALRTPGAPLIPPAVAVLVAGYAVAGIAALRRPAAGDALGAAAGLVAGALWCVEIAGGGPARFSRPVEVAPACSPGWSAVRSSSSWVSS